MCVLLQPPSTRHRLAKPSQDELTSERDSPMGNGLRTSQGAEKSLINSRFHRRQCKAGVAPAASHTAMGLIQA